MGAINEYDHNAIVYNLDRGIQKALAAANITGGWFTIIKLCVLLVAVVVIGILLHYIFRKILEVIFNRVRKTVPLSFFKYTITNRLPIHLALVVPYAFLRSSIPTLSSDFQSLISPAIKIIDISLVFIIIWSIMAVFKSFSDALQEKPAFRDKPMKSYLQVIQIILFIFGAVAMFSIITGKEVGAIFAAMGAASAITMLVFKDSIMGFVSSIQLTTNNMVKLGDWITMNKYGADGTVIDITLTTVKVQNSDKTITTIPTYALISDSFQNWRGMQDSGGRRVKKCLYIQQSTIRFVTDEELKQYKELEYLKDFIANKETEYAKRNKGKDAQAAVGVHRISNNELYIAYLNGYLCAHPGIHQDLTVLVRQMLPTPNGIQIEIYAFANTTELAAYEGISTEILNHAISVTKYFKLALYEFDAVPA